MEIYREIMSRWELLIYLVKTEVKKEYNDKILGFLWSILDPLAHMAVYTVVVVYIFHRGVPGFPVLLYSALLCWRWFTDSFSSAISCLNARSKLILAAKFPIVIVPVSIILRNFISLLCGFAALIPMLVFFKIAPTFNLLYLPVIILIEFLIILGSCLFISIIGVFIRDTSIIFGFVLRMFFYLSPIMYMATNIPERFRGLYMLNPFAAICESVKSVIVLGQPPSHYLLHASLLGIVLTVSGAFFFQSYRYKVVKEF